jgi:hypothetical protein
MALFRASQSSQKKRYNHVALKRKNLFTLIVFKKEK